MSRSVNWPVQMTTGPGGAPISFFQAGAWYHVIEVLDTREEVGHWWGKEPPKTAWRVRVQQAGLRS
jgi:hypothetical protein